MLTDGATTITPLLWMTAEQKSQSQNRVHELMSGRVAVTLGGVTPRRGALGLLLASGEEAAAVEQMHRDGKVFQITEPDRPYLDMTYVLAEGGGIERELLQDPDPDADLWMVRIDYQEVTE